MTDSVEQPSVSTENKDLEVEEEEVKDEVIDSDEEEVVAEAVDDAPVASEGDPLPEEATQEEAGEETSAELSLEDQSMAAPKTDSSRIKSAEATKIQIPDVFLHAEYRKGTSASVAEMPILVTFEAGRKSMRLCDLETLQEGFIFECENPVQASINICANGQLIGKGSLLNVEGRIGVRVTEIY
ncbi:MAG: FliM/FliN family flagellar motor switch protein [Puniceicoccales bacterium]|jgi:type III secretion system YscQ/HrcQ family protein|nr:FliM/FliN family flagellar motor switch protein [Puniceicoccales bacterium]